MSEETKPSILIVDDIPRNIQILGNILKDYNYDIEFATNGKDALEWLMSKKFNLVLLDIMMPVMDGFQVCKKIKENNSLKNISVIFITAKSDTDSIIKGFELGAVDYITKPFNKNELLARVKTHLTIISQQEELENANAFKNKLFSIIGHDLRDPIGSLKSYIEVYTQNTKDIDPAFKTFMNEVSNIAENAYSLLENLLSWARSKTGRIQFNPSLNSINEVVERCTFLLSGIARNKNIKIVDFIPEKTFAFFDPELISAVLRNLIANAIKFSYSGNDIQINSEIIEKQNHTYIQISIKDVGTGISTDKIISIFNTDTHFSTYGTSNEKGSGLGLKICKEFVELNDGEIGVESVKGKGSVFFFTLPLSEKS